jgi:hypothetical protein
MVWLKSQTRMISYDKYLISVILHENKVAALHLYSYFDLALSASKSHSYFTSSYTEKAMKEMQLQNARHVMSMEYFSVARVDVGVAKLSYEIGGLPLDQNIQLHGTPCDLVGCPKGHERLPNGPLENRLADELWSKRLELPPFVSENRFPLKKVA